MSEYQRIAFRAIDAPVSEKELKFMRRQSTRAEITPWSFDNEYDFADFDGDAIGMLRRGYDFHLHYANFGIRVLMLRLPRGLPDANAAKVYLQGDVFQFLKDRKGAGGILRIDPELEPGNLEDLWDLDDLVERLLPLRSEILEGDLRPLYVARLALVSNFVVDNQNEWLEPPLPAGLSDLTDAQRALSELYGLDDALIAAAALKSPALPTRTSVAKKLANWIEKQPPSVKDGWLVELLSDAPAAVRAEVLAKFRATQSVELWPTISSGRTFAQLETAADQIRQQRVQPKTEASGRKRGKSAK